MGQSNLFERLQLKTIKANLAKTAVGVSAKRERVAALEIASLKRKGKRIPNPAGEIKKLAAMATVAERQAHLEYIHVNFADTERSPARSGRLVRAEAEPDAGEIVRHSEENGIDVSTDAGLQKVVAALTKKTPVAAAPAPVRTPASARIGRLIRVETPQVEPEAAELLRYGEDNNIDISTDAGLRKAMTALAKKTTAA